jgi:hypothetical protein
MSEQNKRSTNAEGVRLTVEPTAELIEARDRLPAVIAPAPSQTQRRSRSRLALLVALVIVGGGAGIGWFWWYQGHPRLPPGIAWGTAASKPTKSTSTPSSQAVSQSSSSMRGTW